MQDWRSVRHGAASSTIAVLLLAAVASADGGAVQLRQADGPFLVTVFTAPTPLRAGPADVSVMVQGRDSNEPVLDADVLVTVAPSSGDTLRTAATRKQATNKMLYAATVSVPAGSCDLRVTVRCGSDVANVGAAIMVAVALPPLVAHWPYLAFPPAVVAVFALHQWLRSRASNAS